MKPPHLNMNAVKLHPLLMPNISGLAEEYKTGDRKVTDRVEEHPHLHSHYFPESLHSQSLDKAHGGRRHYQTSYTSALARPAQGWAVDAAARGSFAGRSAQPRRRHTTSRGAADPSRGSCARAAAPGVAS